MSPTLLVCRLDDPAVRPADWYGLLTRGERQRIEGLRQPEARDRALVARALLRLELARRLQCRPEMIEFSFGPEGKPALAGGDAWHFNLSHSHDRVVLALAPIGPIGVDIESRARRTRINHLAHHFYGDGEREEMSVLNDEARRYRFFQLWTIKEAITKALGRGLWTTLSGIRLTGIDTGRPDLRLSGQADCCAPIAWWHFDAGDGYNLALAHLAGNGTPPEAYWIRPGETPDPMTVTADLAGVRQVVDAE
ncbi:MAG: 4'-phosphopantetheinyl transferase family protein [Halofilum sp. (in: g-proteobacteria)]